MSTPLMERMNAAAVVAIVHVDDGEGTLAMYRRREA